ncbi:MAG: lytic transglycosylase domain-containing protein, partial [Candidatus Edwardsbacteria bacterium]|nr:lytic transglycosylase domain-containing protein [Candidatus Edwardsbacteria bacterium]
MRRLTFLFALVAFFAGQGLSGDKLGFVQKPDGFLLTNLPAAAFRVIKQYKIMHRQEYQKLATEAALKYGLSFELLDAVIESESGYDPFCVSHKGAQGLMQLMPQTAKLLGVTDPFDPAQNIDAGARYL